MIIDNAIDRAVSFLRERQLPHGEFKTLLAKDRGMTDPVFDSSPFVTSFVLYALSHLDRASVDDVVSKAVNFLGEEIEFGGVWRYWSSRQHKHHRLPPDLDDTSCISYALRIMDARVPNNRWAFRCARDAAGRFQTWLLPRRGELRPWLLLARSVGHCQARLLARKVVPAGPEDPRFRTMHIVPDDVDPVVNANVVLYLGESAETAGALRYIIDVVTAQVSPFSLYYEDPLALYYAVARAHRHAAQSLAVLKDTIVDGVGNRRGKDESFANPLCAAMAVSVLLTYDSRPKIVEKSIEYIVKMQRDDGGWDAHAFYNVWGSEELTTAFCIEALCRYRPIAGARDGYR
jgi:hypothetical protein